MTHMSGIDYIHFGSPYGRSRGVLCGYDSPTRASSTSWTMVTCPKCIAADGRGLPGHEKTTEADRHARNQRDGFPEAGE